MRNRERREFQGKGCGSGPVSGRGSGRHRGGGTLLRDAVYLASEELMGKRQGRKALIHSRTELTPAARLGALLDRTMQGSDTRRLWKKLKLFMPMAGP
jgi:hypothetical protein